MVRNYRLFHGCWVCLVALLLASCSSPSPPAEPSALLVDNYRYGDIYMQQMNYAIDDKITQKKEAALKKEGVQIITVGQQYKLIISAEILFYPASPRIQWKSYALLNNIVSYIQDFSKIDVKVAGFTQATGNPERDRALGINRARNVSNYLWEQEIGAGIVYVRGYVVTQPSSIEISFRSIVM